MVKVIFLFCTLLFSSLVADNFSVALELADVHYIKDKQGQIKPTVFTNESFRLKVIVTGDKKSHNRVKIAGINRFIKTGESNHSSVSINNSKVSVEKITTHVLQPRKEGSFQIGPAILKQNGKILKSNTVSVYVTKRTGKILHSTMQKVETGQELFCKLKTNKTEVFTEEPIEVTLEIYRGEDPPKIRGTVAPDFPNCNVKELKNLHEKKEIINGKAYSVIEKKYLVYPSKETEALNITPAQIVYHVTRRKKRRNLGFFGNELFSDFFDLGVQQKVATSNPLTIKVKKLPKHDKKIDGIGNFEVYRASVDKTKAMANEPIKLTLTLLGQANFDLVLSPMLKLPGNFKSYDSKIVNHESGKSFEFILQIPKAGIWTIPPQSFHYFDVNKKRYETIQSLPITITTEIPEGEVSAPVVSISKDVPVEEGQKDIHFIEEEVSLDEGSRDRLSILFLFIFILLIPCLVFMSKVKEVAYPFYKKLFVSKNLLAKYQAKLNNIVEFNEPENFYNLFINFLSELHRVPASKIDESWIKLKLKKLSPEKKEAFISFLNECAQYSFASEQINNLEDFSKKANYWLLLIHGRTTT